MEAILEAVKTGLRVVVLAVIPVLIDSLNKNSVDWKAILVVAVVAALTFVDSYLHETKIAEKGLTRF
jgi:hypothetical protein